ncbi:MAG: Holliday junction branch migration protein RuvA [Actinomycetota bacterium]
MPRERGALAGEDRGGGARAVIAGITGMLAEILPDGAIVDVHGVAYRLFMPSTVVSQLPQRGKEIRVHTHLHVREDAMTLYGFSTTEQRDLFAVLLGVGGIGPKGALAVLSVYSPEAFRKALVTEDLDALTLIPGVGKKTAARMILELREKLALPELEVVPGGNGARRAVLVEVKGALLNLGYTPAEARTALESLPDDRDDARVQDLLKLALKELARA